MIELTKHPIILAAKDRNELADERERSSMEASVKIQASIQGLSIQVFERPSTIHQASEHLSDQRHPIE